MLYLALVVPLRGILPYMHRAGNFSHMCKVAHDDTGGNLHL